MEKRFALLGLTLFVVAFAFLAYRGEFGFGPYSGSSGLEAVTCPENALVVVTGGQSNTANSLSDPVEGRADLPAFMFIDGDCYPISDPVVGATDRRGSLWTQLAHQLVADIDQPVVFINGAVGASSFSNWTDLRSGFLPRLQYQVDLAAEQNLVPHLVLWHQGETDATDTNASQAEFADRMTALVDAIFSELRLDPNAKLILMSATTCGWNLDVGNERLARAQADIADVDPRVLFGGNTDQFGAAYRYDGCHFNGRGRDAINEQLLPVILDFVRNRNAT